MNMNKFSVNTLFLKNSYCENSQPVVFPLLMLWKTSLNNSNNESWSRRLERGSRILKCCV